MCRVSLFFSEGYSVVCSGHRLLGCGSKRFFSGLKSGVLCVSVHPIMGLNEFVSPCQIDLLINGEGEGSQFGALGYRGLCSGHNEVCCRFLRIFSDF